MADLVVSLKEARELLGDDAKNLSDEEIERMIILLDEIARESIKQAITERIHSNPELVRLKEQSDKDYEPL